MTSAVSRFYNSIEGAESLSQAALGEFFVYFLTVEAGHEFATPKEVADCFTGCDLSRPANIGVSLSAGLKTKPAKFIKVNGGYKLQRHRREALLKMLGSEQVIAQTSATLRGLELKLPEGANKDFLKEAIDCVEIGANRAAIIMVWILTMDHLFSYILKNNLADFNIALANDKGVKINSITQRDDFSEIKEAKFIELCRAAKIITNDVRKILDQKLGTRNSCAHPSGVNVNRSKVVEFVEDLLDNVVQKYPI